MSDAGTRFTDERQAFLESKFERIYRQAQEEIIEKLDAHTKRQNAQTRVKLAQVKAGTLSEEEFNKWQAGQMFIGKQWKDKVDSVATTLLTANQQANSMVEGEKRAVFGENATFQAYKLEHDAGVDLSFSVYDSATVTRLLRDDPELLPRKRVNGRKDKAWNRRKISDAVAQGIIQGESVDEIAKRIAKQTSNTNKEAMKRYARTAMTAAQNAGRLEVMEEAKDAGIKVKKRWIATLDRRTREAHQHLDGQVQETDKPFWSMLGYIMYPGDPDAKSANTWMCRCTLGYEYDEYPQQYSQRRAYVEYYDDDGEFHRESHEIANMTYDVWKLAKQRDEQRALENWREGQMSARGNVLQSSSESSIINGAENVSNAMQQSSRDSAIPPEYDNDFSDFEQLSLNDEERRLLNDLHDQAEITGFEYGAAITEDGISEAFTSSERTSVKIPEEILAKKSVNLYHSHTNVTCLSAKDFEHLTRENVESIAVKTINGDVYKASVGYGEKPTLEEFRRVEKSIRSSVDAGMLDHPSFFDWTIEQRNYMAIREEAYQLSRRFGWTLEGGRDQ